MGKIEGLLGSIWQGADKLSGGTLGTFRQTIISFNRANGAYDAAGMAYYTLFSLFPLVLALIFVGSFFVESRDVQERVVQAVTRFVPISHQLIRSNIEEVLEQRRTVGLVGLVGLFWSGTGVFTILLNQLTSAWPEAEERGFVERRLMGTVTGVLGVVVVVFLLSFLSAPLLDLLGDLGLGLPVVDWALATAIGLGMPALVTFLMFTALYRWGPNADVGWREAIWPALFVAVTWQVAQRVFTWYVSSGLVRYQLVYGSLGAVVALLLWIYISSVLVLFGAHLGAVMGRERRPSDEHIKEATGKEG
jgi:membrane protein